MINKSHSTRLPGHRSEADMRGILAAQHTPSTPAALVERIVGIGLFVVLRVVGDISVVIKLKAYANNIRG